MLPPAQRRRISLPLWAVLLVAPVAGVIAIAGLVVGAYLVATRLSGDLARLDYEVIRQTEQIAELRLSFVAAEAALLDLAAYAANSTDAEGLAKRSRLVGWALDAVNEQVRHAGSAARPGASPGAAPLLRDIREWNGFARAAAATLADDSGSGMMMISEVQVLYDKISNALAQRALAIRAEKDATLLAAETRMSLVRLWSPVGVFALGAVMCSLSLLAARHIGRRVRDLRHAVTHVAAGDLDIVIPEAATAAARPDEIDRMAQAIEALRLGAIAAAKTEAQVAHMALHDMLTGLGNRALMQARLDQAVAAAGRGLPSALLCLDLDRFKAVNDTYGHPAGDALLQAVADRLKACVRDNDTVSRFGGDEFVVLLSGMAHPEDASAVAQRIVRTINEPFDLGGQVVSVGTSIGIACAPQDARSATELLKRADMALYRTKAEAKGSFRYFHVEMHAALEARNDLERDLREAVRTEAFEIHYQPQIALATDRLCGFEALVRWRHPDRGLVSPAEFIPLAEETGLIVPIGAWVLRNACAEAVNWPETVTLSVNASAVQFKDNRIADTVARALRDTGLPGRRLDIEITETTMMANAAAAKKQLQQLHSLGVTISMDDFGTGYSSLNYLRSFPFDTIKIDRSFVQDIPARDDALAIVRATVAMGRSLGMKVLAEGVETQDQLDHLRLIGCDEVQGYLISRPVPAQAARLMACGEPTALAAQATASAAACPAQWSAAVHRSLTSSG